MSQPPRSPGVPPPGPGDPHQGPGGQPQRPTGGRPSPGNAPPWGQAAPQGRPREPQPSGAPGPEKSPVPKKKLGLIIGASVLALILLIAGVVVAVTLQVRASEQRATEAAQKTETERRAELTRQESAAQAAAQGYLTALTESDPEKALSFAAARPEGDNELLSRDVLLEANNRAAISGVSVGQPALTESAPGSWTEGTVNVRYSLGDQPQTVDLPVRKVGTDWKMSQVSAPVELGLLGPERIVNGVNVEPGDYNLFPGSYSVTSANPLVTLATSEFVLTAPAPSVTDWSSELSLTPEGTNQSLEASKRAVEQCLESKELEPPDCPFIQWAEDGLSIDKSTIRYTLKNDPWVNAQFAFDAGTMTATTSVPVEHEIRAQATQNGTRGALVPQTQRRTAHIIVKVADGTPQVTFS